MDGGASVRSAVLGMAATRIPEISMLNRLNS